MSTWSLLRCYYNFVRPHGALKFGREIRTPAMQAGLTIRRLTFRDIFLATTIPLGVDLIFRQWFQQLTGTLSLVCNRLFLNEKKRGRARIPVKCKSLNKPQNRRSVVYHFNP